MALVGKLMKIGLHVYALYNALSTIIHVGCRAYMDSSFEASAFITFSIIVHIRQWCERGECVGSYFADAGLRGHSLRH